VLVGVLAQYLLIFNILSLLAVGLVVEALQVSSLLVAVAVLEEHCILLA
tara:strand:- start:701 stop:847 length:147 start_codon:yes stop_codon:yes gene_type:complete